MLRFEVSEHDRQAFPAIDVGDDVVIIGSKASAQVRLPAEVARPAHVRIDDRSWTLLADATVDGVRRAVGDHGSIGEARVIEVGRCRIRIAPAPAGVRPTPLRRTDSLARELARSLLGDAAAPSLEIEHGPHAGARCVLPAPESALVIGRGDGAGWVILDGHLSRAHAEIRRGWDSVTVVDLGSRSGTQIDGRPVGRAPVELRDGAMLALGSLAIRFRDPAERHLRGEPAMRKRPVTTPPAPVPPPQRAWSFLACAAIAGLAAAGLIWVLVT